MNERDEGDTVLFMDVDLVTNAAVRNYECVSVCRCVSVCVCVCEMEGRYREFQTKREGNYCINMPYLSKIIKYSEFYAH